MEIKDKLITTEGLKAAYDQLQGETITTIDTIDTEISGIKETITNDYANAIKSSATGTNICLKDSANAPVQKMEVHGKNRFDDSIFKNFEIIDGYYVYNVSLINQTVLNLDNPKTGDVYTFSATGFSENEGRGEFLIFHYLDSEDVTIPLIFEATPKRNQVTTDGTKTLKSVTFVYNDVTIIHIKEVQCEKGNAMTDYTPYVNDIEVMTCGLNLYGGVSGKLYKIPKWESGDALHIFRKNNVTITGGGIYFYDSSKTQIGGWNLTSQVHMQPTYEAFPSAKYFALLSTNDDVGVFMNYEGDYEEYRGITETIDTETQTGWEELKTYYPVTNIIPAQSATIDVEYIADTKNYIDNKLLELTANMVDLATMQMLDN